MLKVAYDFKIFIYLTVASEFGVIMIYQKYTEIWCHLRLTRQHIGTEVPHMHTHTHRRTDAHIYIYIYNTHTHTYMYIYI